MLAHLKLILFAVVAAALLFWYFVKQSLIFLVKKHELLRQQKKSKIETNRRFDSFLRKKFVRSQSKQFHKGGKSK
jgi:hypothetical protein